MGGGVGRQDGGGKIRVKRPCLLWQSPRPSVLPCSTSCSKADLRGTETSWSAEERKEKKREEGWRADALGKIAPDRASGPAGKATTVRTPHKGCATLWLSAA